MAQVRSLERLQGLFAAKTVVDLPAIQAALGGVSAMTAFRYLRQVPYRRSYNHNGRFYTLYKPSRYDRSGLWSWGDIHFSVDGSLRATVHGRVCQALEGATHRELQDRLRVRVHNTLGTLVGTGELSRERVGTVYVYLHPEPGVRQQQLARRGARIASEERVAPHGEVELSDRLVIQVLLTLLRHPGSQAAAVMRFLRGHSPPITFEQVRAVFTRYDLEALGEKGGGSNC